MCPARCICCDGDLLRFAPSIAAVSCFTDGNAAVFPAQAYPVGLVPSALGASSLNDWSAEKELYRELLARKPLVGAVKGLLWYQGCADTSYAQSRSYAACFTAFIERLRADWEQDMPVMTVQIGRYGVPQDAEVTEGWSYIRQIQHELAKKTSGVMMVPSYDLPRGDVIHLSAEGQRMLGRRLAVKALECLYGLPICGSAPELARIERLDDKSVLLTFAPIQGTLLCFPETLPKALFSVEDSSGFIAVSSYEYRYPDGLILRLEREFTDDAEVSYLTGIGADGPYPMDLVSLLPIVPFYKVKFTKV